ncbi:MAG: EAL domain-containing protein [Burkholderiales bacterium]|nr:EAL domain-containing protein [Burkholderiales bacterium]
MTRPRLSLRTKMLIAALPVIVVLTLATTMLINRRHAAAMASESARNQAETASLYADLAAEPFWKLDRTALGILSRRMLELTGVDEVEVLDERDRSFLAVRRPQRPGAAGGTVLTRDLVYASPVTPSKRIGRIRITFDAEDAARDSWSSIAWEFGLVMFTMLAMLLLAAVLYQRLIWRPLEHLLRAIRASESGDRYVQVELQRSDEIGEIIAAYNSMQRHLAAHTQRLTQIYNQTPGLLFSIDAAGRFVSVSDYLCGYLGHGREALVGSELLRLAPSTDPEVAQRLRQAFIDGSPANAVPLTIRRGDGSSIHVLLNSFVETAGDGTVADSICVMSDITKQIEDQALISKQANFDLITGLPNRYMLLDGLRSALAAADRDGSRVAVVFLDLDRFKSVNDTLGHRAGDQLLLEVSQRFKERLRLPDTIGRFGGDEFVVVLSRARSLGDVEAVCQRLLDSLALPVEIENQSLFVSASLGVAMFPDDGREADALLSCADTAMYRAKRNGRNTMCFFKASMNVELKQRMETERRLRDAVHRGLFTLHYQPIVELAGERVVGYEALVRMIDPDKGTVISPAEFITVAEEIGVISEIGAWVLEQAVDRLASWPVAAGGPSYIAVNVSPRQLERPGFVDKVRSLVQARGIDPERLVLEITESCVVDDVSNSLAMLHALRGLGCRLALDDFGTGYSSLSMLRQLPVQTLKIDRSFIAAVPHQSAACELVQAVLALAQALNLDVVAEGIEEVAQADFMRTHGGHCCGQGYLFGRPAELPLRRDEQVPAD